MRCFLFGLVQRNGNHKGHKEEDVDVVVERGGEESYAEKLEAAFQNVTPLGNITRQKSWC